MPRVHCPGPLAVGQDLALPSGAARHVQVLRMQPGMELTLFDGHGGEFAAVITRMGRSDVQARVQAHRTIEKEAGVQVHLALGMPANERMDWLVEKAAELGVAGIQPLHTQHGVLRLQGERAHRKQAHWQGIAVAACEQSGRNRVPVVHEVRAFGEWLAGHPPGLLLSLREGALPLRAAAGMQAVTVLSGPEGGLSPAEEESAMRAGWRPVRLGPQVLRAETAPLAALTLLTLGA